MTEQTNHNQKRKVHKMLMDMCTAEKCEALAQSCVNVFQGIASGDFSDQWIRRNLETVKSMLSDLYDETTDALDEDDENEDT